MKLKTLLYEILFVGNSRSTGGVEKPSKMDKINIDKLNILKNNEYVKSAEQTKFKNQYYDDDNVVKITLKNGKVIMLTYDKRHNGVYFINYLKDGKRKNISNTIHMSSNFNDIVDSINKIGKRK